MIAAGLVGGLSLGYLQIAQNQDTFQKKVEADFEIDMIALDIFQTLSDDDACAKTLGNSVSEGKVLTQIKNSADKAVFQAAKQYGQNLIKIDSIVLRNLDITTDSIGSVDVAVTFEKTSKTIKNAKKEVRRIPLSIRATASTVECNPDGSERFVTDLKKSLCDSLSGELKTHNDSFSGVVEECFLPFDESFCPHFASGVDENGKLICTEYPQ